MNRVIPHRMSRSLIPLCILLSGLASILHSQTWYRIVENTQERLIIDVEAPAVAWDTVSTEEGLFSRFRVPDWPLLQEAALPALPHQVLLLNWPCARAGVTIVSAASPQRISMPPPWRLEDVPALPQYMNASPSPLHAVSGPGQLAEMLPLGHAAGEKLWRLRICPYHYDVLKQELSCFSHFRLEISAEAALAVPGRAAPSVFSDLSHPARPASMSAVQTAARFKAAGPCKIYIDEDGWYRITGAELQAAGLKLLDIDFKRLKLTRAGKSVPIFASGWRDGQFHDRDYFEFWGETLRQTLQHKSADLYQDPYSKVAVYWLSWDDAQTEWLGEEPTEALSNATDAPQRPFSFYETVHVEEDNYFQHYYDIGMIDSLRDHWLFDGGIPSGSKRTYSFTLRHPDARSALPVQVRAMLTGVTSDNPRPHQAALFLNDRFVRRGQALRQSILELSSFADMNLLPGYLRSGSNTLTVFNEYDPSQTDYLALNWFEITFPRLYRAHDNFLKFSIPPDYDLGLFQFMLDGFTTPDVEIFKLGAGKITGASVARLSSVEGGDSYRVQFNDTVPSRQTCYVAVTAAAKKAPLRIERVEAEWNPAADNQVDYVAIVPRKWARDASLTALLQWRQSQGHRVARVALEDILDHFNHGLRSPHAIKAFLKWAYQSWPLRYVLLVGDGSYHRETAAGDTLDIMPVYMRQTLKYGAASCDYWYGLLQGDDEFADVFVGRLPAVDAEQLKVVVDKILAHEKGASMGAWRNRLLFIGGNGMIFRDKGIALAAKTPPAFDTALLFTTRDATLANDPFFGSTPQLLDHLDQGCAVVNFHGHGGGAIWSDNGLLRLEDVEVMSNRNRYPIVLSMTCYTGAFEQVQSPTLAETMLFTPERGTMAFLGASGFGWRDNDDYLQTAIMDWLYEHPGATLGEIIYGGKTRYFAQSYGHDISLSEVNQYNLLGDPATRLRLATQKASVSLDKTFYNRSDTLRCQVIWPFAQGSGVLEWNGENGIPLASIAFTFANATSAHALVLPPVLSSQDAVVRVYGEDGLGLAQAHGAGRFSLGEVFFDSTQVVTAGGDSLYFRARVAARGEIRQLWCLYGSDSLALSLRPDGWYQSALARAMDRINYTFVAVLQDGSEKKSTTTMYIQPDRMDLEVTFARVSWGGEIVPELHLPIRNWGAGSGPVTVQLQYWNTVTHLWEAVAEDTVLIKPRETVIAALPAVLPPGPAKLHFIVQAPGAVRRDIAGKINVTAFGLAAGGGFLCQTGICDSLQWDDRTWLVSPGAAGNGAMVVSVQTLAAAAPLDQPDFYASAAVPVYDIRFSRPAALGAGLELLQDLSAAAPLPGDLTAAAVFRYAPETRKWMRQEAVPGGRLLKMVLRQDGRYTILWARDGEPPRIQAMFDGKPYSHGMYVSREPHLLLHILDHNGIDISPGAVLLTLDGNALEQEDCSLPDSVADGNRVTLNIRPHLEPGTHRLMISARDCNGNASAPLEMFFQVAGDFSVQWLGNYPNPFAKKTVFAYLLTQAADWVSLQIYTAAGRKIFESDGRTMGEDPHPLSSDYHELTWEGDDEEGRQVANGVYFYRFTARAGGVTREVTGKLARLK